jgi:DNA-binding MarR family transcriptional regulator
MASEDLALVIESLSKALQDIGSGLYLKAFADKGISALSLVQFRYFELIARRPGITPGELSTIMKVSRPTVANVLAGFDRKGLIRREKSVDDGRVLHVYLAAGAREIAEYRSSMYRLMADRLRRALTRKECADMTRMMRKSLDHLGKTGGAGRGKEST